MRHFARIKSGSLTVTTELERVPLVDILTYAARPNPKRGFYFVSKVLGRHLPVAPSVFNHHMKHLAELVEDDTGPYLVVGLGEAAVGMGGAVARHLAVRTGERVIYTFTTRQALDAPVMCSFDEAHSHAPNHLLYAPHDALRDDYLTAEHLVLVDDEMTTGRTVTELAKKLCVQLPKLRKVTVLALVSWVKPEQQYALAEELPTVSFTFDALVSGTSSFIFSTGYEPVLPLRTDTEIGQFYPADNTGRRGVLMSDIDTRTWALPEHLSVHEPVLVMGSVEFSFQPYLLAERLETEGYKVAMLCATRTPILVGDAIKARFSYDSILGDPNSPVHYLYNVPSDHQMVVGFENRRQVETYGLQDEIDFTPWVMDEAIRAS